MIPGAPMDDAPVDADGRAGWLLEAAGGRFQAMVFTADPARLDAGTVAALKALADGPLPVDALIVADVPGSVDGVKVVVDRNGVASRRYDGREGTTYVLRPDQHVCARMRRFDADAVRRAVARATGNA
jgi:3-(3-hydroxy-phenyl)propionate hydroxylase